MVGIFWVVVGGDGWWSVYCYGGGYILRGSWWVVVPIFWKVVVSGWLLLDGYGWRWVFSWWWWVEVGLSLLVKGIFWVVGSFSIF